MAVTTKKLLHAHGCPKCFDRFEDACATPNEQLLCTVCRGGQPWQVLIDGRAPRDCCRYHHRPATREQVKAYALAGGCEWFRCSVCGRTFPFRPPQPEAP